MPYPENFNTTAFNATIGSRQSDADQIYDAMAAHVQDIVNRAFADYPLDEPTSSNNRWTMICNALDKAERSLLPFVSLTAEDQAAIDHEGFGAIDANTDCDKLATAQQVGAILYVYRAAIDRVEAA